MLRLHGVYRSRAARNIWLLEELGLPYDHVPVVQRYRLTDEEAANRPHTQTPAFKALSPAAAVPVLEDDDLVLSESMAINLHLARTRGGDLGPRDTREQALMDEWSFYAITAIEPPALEALYADQATEAGRAAATAAADRLRRPFAVLNGALEGSGWLVGGRFTVADINMAEVVRYAMALPGLIEAFPAIANWIAGLHARPAFQKMWQAREAETL
ncbi:glutathione S-transferase family protein [Albidovulum sediminicola]|uniref:Glutathione S-transferase family protein n=1 Tax=Albidovulum sediminicola TaxID=2984331 RepID=A0ABT2Z1K3_9RHOB|nr:glutathione S-transferase family protein [Defluviimonas sp. WL0075]MCV2864965.1 glutathione S-transferase family protein [Defluviimonas sp. WL0075]